MSKTNTATKTETTAPKTEDLKTVLAKLPTKSAKIRYLHSQGLKVSAICKLIQYDDGRNLLPQHAHNVLKQPLPVKKTND